MPLIYIRFISKEGEIMRNLHINNIAYFINEFRTKS